MRLDLRLAERWIKPQSRVLDLGCGDGELLAHLRDKFDTKGYGLEIDEEKINDCVARGVNVIQQNLNKGLSNFGDNSFDSVIMTQALQAVEKPDQLLNDMLRVGKQAIITFPNFAHWKTRSYLFFKGQMPVSEALPYSWYDTPNIHLCTFRDFEALCHKLDIKILNRLAVDDDQQGSFLMKYLPNLMGEVAIYRVSR
ncbi:methionine biosynthesis protein MetW [Moraxellaceae bacterium AER2_44_116]|nr:methionine biosynthesis protein MetW [Moraxellaceae bacterium]TQC99252.1 methionine biosynthesis protein MetW [Moraxellaceae bacterium AER2_44_116]